MSIILPSILMMLFAKLMDFSSSSADIDGQKFAMSNLMNLQVFLIFNSPKPSNNCTSTLSLVVTQMFI